MTSLLGFKRKVVLTAEEKLRNAVIRRNLSQEFSKTVKKLQQKNAQADETFYSDDVTSYLCCLLEAIFLHGLKDSSSQSFWRFVSKFTHKDVIAQIKGLKQISSEVGYCRAWIRVALNDGLVESYIHSMILDTDTLSRYYNPVAYLRDLEAPDILQSILCGMQTLQFQLSTNSTVLNLWPREPLVLAGYQEQSDDPPPLIRKSPGPESELVRGHSGSERSASSNDEGSMVSASLAAHPSLPVTRASSVTSSEPEFSSLDVTADKGSESVSADAGSTGYTSSARSTPVSLPPMPEEEGQTGLRRDQLPDHHVIDSLEDAPGENRELAVHVGGEKRRKGKKKGQERRHHPASNVKSEGAVHHHSLENVISASEEKVLRVGRCSPREGAHDSRDETPDVSEKKGQRSAEHSPQTRRKSPVPKCDRSSPREDADLSITTKTSTIPRDDAAAGQKSESSADDKETANAEIQRQDSNDDDSTYTKSEDLDTTVLDYKSLFPSFVSKGGEVSTDTSSRESSQKDLTSGKLERNIPAPRRSDRCAEGRAVSQNAASERRTRKKGEGKTQHSSLSVSPKAKPLSSASKRISSSPSSHSPSPPDAGPSRGQVRRCSGCPGLKAKGDPISTVASPVLGDQLEAAVVENPGIGSVREGLLQGSARRGSKPAVEAVLHGSPVVGNSLSSRQGWSSSFEAEYSSKHPAGGAYQEALQDLTIASPPCASLPSAESGLNPSDPNANSSDDTDVEERSLSSLDHGFIELMGIDVLNEYMVVELEDLLGQNEESSLDLTQIAQESSLVSQNMKCHGCAAPIGYIYGDPLVCSLDGHCYCCQCQEGDEAVIPAFVLHNWDFKKYPVSKANCAYLQEVQETTEFNIEEISPGLYDAIQALPEIRELRTQLRYLKTYLYTCKESIANELRKKVWPREYLYLEPDVYTISDLIQVTTGQMAKQLREIIKFAMRHVYKCPLCSERGFICELCHNPKIIYPFEIDSTYRCEDCSAVYHRTCKTSRVPCPKCQRRQKMALRSIPRVGSRTFDIMDYAYSPENDS